MDSNFSKLLQEQMESYIKKTNGSKEDIINNFNKSVDEHTSAISKANTIFISNPIPTSEKIDSRERVSLSTLTPVLIKDLVLEKTHRGIYIQLIAVSKVLIYSSVSFIVEDSSGIFILLLPIYNIIVILIFIHIHCTYLRMHHIL